MSDFDAFISTAWDEHGDAPEAVAERLAEALYRVDASTHVAPFARLVAHVYGEHLGRFAAGLALLADIRNSGVCTGDPDATSALDVASAMLRLVQGTPAALEGLAASQRIAALATAAAAFAGRSEFGTAIVTYRRALAEAGGEAASGGAPATRALAVAGNNLAAALEQKPARSGDETAGMLEAAHAALFFWRLAGTWLEEERAHYRLGHSRLAAGDARGAINSAEECLALCTRHAAPDLERFFGEALLATATRAAGDSAGFERTRRRALESYERVLPEERAWCASTVAQLDERARRP